MSEPTRPPEAGQTAAPARKRRLLVRTWGCQMNVYDSARMAGVLAPHGYEPADGPEDADVVVLNTCHIRERATEKVFSDLGRVRAAKEARAARGERTVVAVAGCVAQAEGAEIAARAPWVDIVVGTHAYHRLPELVARATRAAGAVVETDFPAEDKFDRLPEEPAPGFGINEGPVAFLAVQEGCDKFCAFCVVPYTRGAERSRPVAAVLAEARRLVARGAREVVLLGQNVNAYHGEGPDGRAWSLARLLADLANLPGVLRLRYTTSHPRDVTEDLIAAHRDNASLMPFLHLPVQSGSDRVLAAMNRGHGADDYRRLADRLRAARPDLALSSDFIVGHPGERAEDHEATMRLVRDVGFALAYSFKYSARPGTPAAALPGGVPEAEKAARLRELQALLREQQDAFNAACVGREVEALVTGPGRHAGQALARSPWLQPVHFRAPRAARPGDAVRVRLDAAHPNSLSATVLRAADAPDRGPAPDPHREERPAA